MQIVISGADAVALDGRAVTVRALAADQLRPRLAAGARAVRIRLAEPMVGDSEA